jgi:hypothetical protein
MYTAPVSIRSPVSTRAPVSYLTACKAQVSISRFISRHIVTSSGRYVVTLVSKQFTKIHTGSSAPVLSEEYKFLVNCFKCMFEITGLKIFFLFNICEKERMGSAMGRLGIGQTFIWKASKKWTHVETYTSERRGGGGEVR